MKGILAGLLLLAVLLPGTAKDTEPPILPANANSLASTSSCDYDVVLIQPEADYGLFTLNPGNGNNCVNKISLNNTIPPIHTLRPTAGPNGFFFSTYYPHNISAKESNSACLLLDIPPPSF